MNQPIKDYWETAADTCVAQYKELSAAMDAAIKAGAMDINGPLHETIWKTFDAMLDLIDPTKWISWFIYDNNCGKDARKACGPNQKLRAVRTTKQLARIIRASH